MTRSVYVEFRDDRFWVYDVVSTIFAKCLVDVACPFEDTQGPWLQDAIHEWRVNAIVSDYCIYLNDDWTPSQVEFVAYLFAKVSTQLRGMGRLSLREVASWRVLGEPLFARGHDPIA